MTSSGAPSGSRTSRSWRPSATTAGYVTLVEPCQNGSFAKASEPGTLRTSSESKRRTYKADAVRNITEEPSGDKSGGDPMVPTCPSRASGGGTMVSVIGWEATGASRMRIHPRLPTMSAVRAAVGKTTREAIQLQPRISVATAFGLPDSSRAPDNASSISSRAAAASANRHLRSVSRQRRTISTSTTPNAHRSARRSTAAPRACSGDM